MVFYKYGLYLSESSIECQRPGFRLIDEECVCTVRHPPFHPHVDLSLSNSHQALTQLPTANQHNNQHNTHKPVITRMQKNHPFTTDAI